MGTLTWIIPLESAVTASSPAQLFVHSPATADAHSTDATLPGARLLHTSTPFPLNEVMTGVCACAATAAPSAKAHRPILKTCNAVFIFCSPLGRFVLYLRLLHCPDS
jgi:hypothetical protein